MSSVAIVYRKDKLNKKNEAPIHFRIIKDRKPTYISTGIMLHQDLWDGENHKVKAKHTHSKRINSLLANKFAELQDEVYEHETFEKSLTSKQLRNKIYGQSPTDFFAVAQDVLDIYESEGKVGTHDKCKSIIKKFKSYNENRVIYFQDITFDYLTRYEKYLRTSKGNKTNTVHKDLKFIRRIFNEAIKRDIIEPGISPFLKYKIKLDKTTKEYLTEAELTKMEKLVLKEGSLIECHRNMFVFASYTGGLRVSDVLKLKWGQFDGTHVHVTIKKTKEQLSIKIPDKALEIIRMYMPKKPKSNDYIFPVLRDGLDESDLRLFDNAITSATTLINKNLKIIAERAKITKSISFHISRHTWATLALNKGVAIEKVSKIMGHAQIKETQIYAKIANKELDKAMDAFN